MTIDLSKFAAKTTAVVPVVGGVFQHNRKKYRVQNSEDAWYNVEMQSNSARLLDKAYITEQDFDKTKLASGYTFGNNFFFSNFDTARRKYRREMHVPALFNVFDTFNSVKAVFWEDENFYVIGPNYTDMLVYQVKTVLDTDEPLDAVKGVTPELRVVFAMHLIQKQQLAEQLRKAEEEQKRKEFMQTIPGQLEAVFKRSGGEMTKCTFINYADPLRFHPSREDRRMNGRFAEVEWHIPGMTERFNTVINLDTMMIHDAGFCMSGADRKFNVTGMIQTAKDYKKNAFINITRGDRLGRDWGADDEDPDW